MASPKPAVLLIHGAYLTPAHYEPLTTALSAAGFHALCPRLPTSSGARPPTATVDDDIATARAALATLVTAGRPVLLLAHSYGGMVASQCVAPELTRAHRNAAGASGGAAGLLYVCAFLARRGEAPTDHIGRRPPTPAPVDGSGGGDGAAVVPEPVPFFFHDVEPARAADAAARLVAFPGAVLRAPLEVEGWRAEGLRVGYVVCSEDRAIPPTRQWAMVRAVEAEGVRVATDVLESSHSPFLSRTAELVQIVGRMWEDMGITV